jgi:hypothetical protein
MSGRNQPPDYVPFFQRPVVRRIGFWSFVTMFVGYVISRVGVISEHERQDVLVNYTPMDHSRTELYETIRRSEERVLKARGGQ